MIDKSKLNDVARLVMETTSPFKEGKIVSIELRTCLGPLPAEIQARQLMKLATDGQKVKSKADFEYGEYDTMEIVISPHETYSFSLESFGFLSKKMKRITGYELDYFNIRGGKLDIQFKCFDEVR